MQAMSARYETAPVQQLTIKSEMGHRFALIPWRGRHVCVMLDPHYMPYYKQAPWDENFCLSPEDFKAIDHQGFATETVIASLVTHMCETATKN
jgi:hypothetical protein